MNADGEVSTLRVFGLWLLYAIAGVFVALAAAGDGNVDFDDSGSPTRLWTKVVGALSGIGLAVGGLGVYLVRDEAASDGAAEAVMAAGFALGGIATIAAWVMIHRDLAGRNRPST